MAAGDYNVRDYGAVGDGRAVDTPAIRQAIAAATAAGGGRICFPAGTYASFSIRLESRLELHLSAGATLLAAEEGDTTDARYDPAEPNEWGDVHRYQDFGHSHWHNSLIWGEELEDVVISGPGRIDGRGLHHGLDAEINEREGGANKAIGLKRCRRVVLRDLTMVNAGHFAVLATGVDQLTIENLTIDTQRDALDIDCCRFVTIRGCRINTPHDDAIVLKSSYALGEGRATENVLISDCTVSGFDLGTMVNGTYGRTQWDAPDGDGPTGRIKLGTESYGGFRDIVIANCCFVRSRGLAIESVDGAVVENVLATNLVMREVVSSPLFVRLGARLRGPAGTKVGAIRRVRVSHLLVEDADARFASLVTGIPGAMIEDLTLSDITIRYRGGITWQHVADQPPELVSAFFQRGADGARGSREPFAVPDRPAAYPEPSMFGVLPAYGLYLRHAKDVRCSEVRLSVAARDERPGAVLEQVTNAAFERFEVDRPAGQAAIVLRQVDRIEVVRCAELPDTRRESRTTEELR